MSRPLVLGAGPAGCMAATLLARGGAKPILIDRDAEVGDALCGGFMSWRTAKRLRHVGLELADLGAHRVSRLVLFTGEQEAHCPLPETGFGLSRRALDSAMRAMAMKAGATLEIDRARAIEPGRIEGERQDWRSEAIFLASGKHDVRGLSRPRADADTALGLRVRIPAQDALTALVGDAIELHFFEGGYAGIVLQEDGAANVCLALRKSLLAKAEGEPSMLLNYLAEQHPTLGARMAFARADLPVQTIGAVPYGWIAEDTQPGLYRLGDQAAVIPSLAGEGMGIALASGEAAANAFLGNIGAPEWQAGFARRAEPPVRAAKLIWSVGERASGGRLMTRMAAFAPWLARFAMGISRID